MRLPLVGLAPAWLHLYRKIGRNGTDSILELYRIRRVVPLSHGVVRFPACSCMFDPISIQSRIDNIDPHQSRFVSRKYRTQIRILQYPDCIARGPWFWQNPQTAGTARLPETARLPVKLWRGPGRLQVVDCQRMATASRRLPVKLCASKTGRVLGASDGAGFRLRRRGCASI